MPSSSSLTSSEASKLIALASPSFIAVFLLTYIVTLSLRLTIALHHPPSIDIRSTFLPQSNIHSNALASFLYGISGLCCLLSLPSYAEDASQSSLVKGSIIAQGLVTQGIVRLGAVFFALDSAFHLRSKVE